MKNLFSNKFFLSISILLFIILPLVAIAFTLPEQVGESNSQVFSQVSSNIIKVIYWIAYAAVIILFIFAGISFLTAQGDPEKLKTAKNAFLWAVVGVVVILISVSIYPIMKNLLGQSGAGGGGININSDGNTRFPDNVQPVPQQPPYAD